MYTWTQTLSDVEVRIPIAGGVRAKALDVELQKGWLGGGGGGARRSRRRVGLLDTQRLRGAAWRRGLASGETHRRRQRKHQTDS